MSSKETPPKSHPGALSRKAALAQTVIISVVVLIFSVAIIVLNSYRLQAQVESKIAGIARLAETSLATSVWQVDHASAKDFINAVMQDPTVVFAQVITGRETMAARAKPTYAGHSFTFFQDKPQFEIRSVEIRKYGDWIGTFNLAVSVEGIRHDILINAAGTLGLALILILTISQTTLYFSRKRLFEPLKRLEESATTIADGDLDAPIDTHLPGELGSLARSIDDMRDSVRNLIDDLRDSKARLEDHRNALENTVKERTDELKQKNDSLNQALEDIQNAKRAAEVANVAKSSFLASMSHEIRTPMNAILGMADILWETKLTEDQSRYVQVFRTAGESLLEILDDILDLSKIEAGHLSLEETGFNLGETVDKACTVIETKAEGKGLTFSCSIAPEVPDRLIGDPNRLRQIILNLLGNAVKFTETGKVHLGVEMAKTGTAQPLLQFSVSDTGPGIPSDKLDSIFDSFTQADNSTTRKYGGTGLGLAISKELVRMMGGRIWVESSYGNGSTFLFTARFGVAAIDANKPTKSDDTPVTIGELPPLNILMLEDSRYNAFVIQTYLKNTPCSLTVKEDGQAGLMEFRKGGYDCVLMDIQMPVMDGYEATAAIRKWEQDNDLDRTPVIAMTAYARSEDAQKCAEAGADTHLAKPVKKSALFEVLKELLVPNSEGELLLPSGMDEHVLEELKKSITAAYSALERNDLSSIKALAGDITQRGKLMSLDAISGYGNSLKSAAESGAHQQELKDILGILTDYMDGLSTP